MIESGLWALPRVASCGESGRAAQTWVSPFAHRLERTAERNVSSDIAFWGNIAFHNNYDGFRVVDISAPANPKLIHHQRCNGDQGDIFVWENILVRSWNSPAPARPVL